MKFSIYALLADAFGIAHFILVNLIAILGSVTPLFLTVGGKYPGIKFVYDFINAPVWRILKPYVQDYQQEAVSSFLVFQLVAAVSSVLYAGLFYVIIRSIGTIVGVKPFPK